MPVRAPGVRGAPHGQARPCAARTAVSSHGLPVVLVTTLSAQADSFFWPKQVTLTTASYGTLGFTTPTLRRKGSVRAPDWLTSDTCSSASKPVGCPDWFLLCGTTFTLVPTTSNPAKLC